MAASDATIWLVIFYVPWCEHTKALTPQLEFTANKLISDGYKIEFGSVDVSTQRNLGWKFRIDRSPFLKILIKEGEEWIATDYNGAGKAKSIFEFCLEFYKVKNVPFSNLPIGFQEGDVVELDDSNFDDIIFSSNEIWMITFSAPWCYHCNLMKPNWIAAAKELGSNVRFATVNADANRGLARRFFVRTLPTMKFYYAGYDKDDSTAQSYTSGRTYEDIFSFATDLRADFESDPEKYSY